MRDLRNYIKLRGISYINKLRAAEYSADISMVPLEKVRAGLTVIPHEPTIFSGTLRFNKDPEGLTSYDEVIDILEKA